MSQVQIHYKKPSGKVVDMLQYKQNGMTSLCERRKHDRVP